MITVRGYQKQDAAQAMEIWNEVVCEGVAFPQLDELTEQEADDFFTSQSYTGVAVDNESSWLPTCTRPKVQKANCLPSP